MAAPTDPFAARILIVDDQPSNVRLLEFTLRRAGYSAVTSTVEPRDVQSLHEQNAFDLIVLDLQMPFMDGFKVMELLKPLRETLPVSILVMTADSAQKAAALAGGATSFLGKPYKLPDVVERVGELLRMGTAEQSVRQPVSDASA